MRKSQRKKPAKNYTEETLSNDTHALTTKIKSRKHKAKASQENQLKPSPTLHGLTTTELQTPDFKTLKERMLELGLNKQQIIEVKAIRRRNKNRLSARTCANKKREKETTLIKQVANLRKKNHKLRSQLSATQQELTELKAQLETKAQEDSLAIKVEEEQAILRSMGLTNNSPFTLFEFNPKEFDEMAQLLTKEAQIPQKGNPK